MSIRFVLSLSIALLSACGGSDYHGLGNTGELLPGTMGPPMETVERLEEASRKLSQSSR